MDVILLKNIELDGVVSDICIKDGKFASIAPSGKELPACVTTEDRVETVDCRSKVALPGFVNMHTHAAMSLMRGVGEDMVFHDWIDRIWQIEKSVDDEYVYWATKAACLEMIKSGTTSYNDHYWHPSAGCAAAVECGLRPMISLVAIDRNDADEAERQKELCIKLYEESRSWAGEAMMAVGFHAIYSVTENLIVWCSDFAKKHNLRLHIHLSETQGEVDECIAKHGVSPVRYLADLGVLGPHLIAAHTLWLSDEDVELLGKHKVSCVHNINSNLKLSSGYKFRYNELRDAGANVCMGTDGCASSNNLDMLETLKTSAMVQKAWRNDPLAMPLDELLSTATINGGRAMGLNIGEIKVGNQADMMIIDTNNVQFISPAPFLANFIYSAHSDSIDSVICKGKFLMRGRKVNGEEEILEQAKRLSKKIVL